MVEVVEFAFKNLHGLSLKNAFKACLFQRETTRDVLYEAESFASVYDWSFEGICSYFSSPVVGCWPVLADLRSLKKEHEKLVLPEHADDEDLLHALERRRSVSSITYNIFRTFAFEGGSTHSV